MRSLGVRDGPSPALLQRELTQEGDQKQRWPVAGTLRGGGGRGWRPVRSRDSCLESFPEEGASDMTTKDELA